MQDAVIIIVRKQTKLLAKNQEHFFLRTSQTQSAPVSLQAAVCHVVKEKVFLKFTLPIACSAICHTQHD